MGFLPDLCNFPEIEIDNSVTFRGVQLVTMIVSDHPDLQAYYQMHQADICIL